MRFLFVSFVLIPILVICSTKVQSNNCYVDESKCVPEISRITDVIWKDCTEFCAKCKGLSSGKCEKVDTPACKSGYRCQCHGNQVAKSEVLKERATCRLGL